MDSKLGGPYLSSAVLCEKVLNEKDHVFSLIRIVDRVTINYEDDSGESELPLTPINIMFFISFQSGSYGGKKTLNLEFIQPNGARREKLEVPLLFQPSQSNNLVVEFDSKTNQEGLHWFVLKLDEVEFTRVPLTVNFRLRTR